MRYKIDSTTYQVRHQPGPSASQDGDKSSASVDLPCREIQHTALAEVLVVSHGQRTSEESAENPADPKAGRPHRSMFLTRAKLHSPRRRNAAALARQGGAHHSLTGASDQPTADPTPLPSLSSAPGPTGTAPYAKGGIVNRGQSP